MFITATLATTASLLAGCGGPKGPRRPGGEWLAAIRVENNEQLDDDLLITGLALRRAQQRGRAPDPYVIQVDADRIRGEYLRRGYLDVDVRSRVEREANATTVIFTVDEGPRARTRVVITGLPDDPALPEAAVRELLPLEEGAPFDYEVYDEAKPALETVVEDAGYAHAKLEASVVADRASSTAIVRLDYIPGPKSVFGDIVITGVEGELLEAVRARVELDPGQTYSTSAIAATQRNLYALNRFSTVHVQPEETGEPVVGVTIDVTEGARRQVTLGGGFGADPASYEVRGRAGYSITGWPFPLDTVTVDLRPAYARLRDTGTYEPRLRALTRLERQDLFWTYSRGEIEVAYNYIAYEAYTSYGPRLRLGVATPIGSERLQVRVGWGLQRLDFRTFHPLIDEAVQMRLGLDQTERNGIFEQSLILDLRDHPVETTFGLFAQLHVEEGTRFAGGAFEYVQVVPELRGYVPIGPVVLAARARVGTTRGDLPPTTRLFSGGGSRHRGFAERKLAPSVFGLVDDNLRSIPYGGGALLETGVEARIPITTIKEMPLGGVVFLDGGDATERFADIEIGNLHWAAGLGLRLLTIVGPVRADLGLRLNRKGPMEPEPDSSFAFHLSLGEAF